MDTAGASISTLMRRDIEFDLGVAGYAQLYMAVHDSRLRAVMPSSSAITPKIIS